MSLPFYSVDSDHNSVRGWSVEHIPFGHRQDWVSKFRSELRDSLSQLDADGDTSLILNASYSSAVDVVVADVENRLFYNVGTGPFKKAAQRGVRFRKADWKPNSRFADAQYFYEYSLADQKTMPDVGSGNLLLSFEASFASFSQWSSWPAVWFALKEAKVPPKLFGGTKPPERIAVSATVMRPTSHAKNVNLAGKVKAVIDGIVCALHSHQPSEDRAVDGMLVNRLAKSISDGLGRPIDENLVGNYLLDESTAILGPTQLLRKRGNGYQCNPSDHLCFRGELLMETAEGNDWQLRVKIFGI